MDDSTGNRIYDLLSTERLDSFTDQIERDELAYNSSDYTHIDQCNMPTLETVQETLLTLLGSGLNSHGVCKHISRGGYLRSFVRSGICSCFSRPGRYLHPFSKNSRHDCFCDRERYLNCRDCGAIYSWFLDAGHVILMHRYVCEIHKATSAAWLALLDEDSYRNKLFDHSTRHVMWCDTPQCAVGNGRRWESMVKMNMGNQEEWRDGRNSDYAKAKKRSEETGYRLPLLPE